MTLAARAIDLERVLLRLVELGPPSELRSRAPAEAARALDLDRVLLTSVEHGQLVAEALHLPAGADADALLAGLREHPVTLEYPLLESEVVRRRRPEVLRSPGDRRAFADALGWEPAVVAPIVLDGRVLGLLHADRQPSGRAVDDRDASDLGTFALCFALTFERAALRHRQRLQREEMRQMAAWADARTSELGDRSTSLAESHEDAGASGAGEGHGELRDLLTRREHDVLELLVRGETNAAIARELVLSEGTIKFHVKNILRKLHAANRAEATSRYMRLTLGQRP